jgi:hypothetical protein
MNIKRKNFKLKIEDRCIDLLWTIPKKKNIKDRWLWLKYSNTKQNQSIWGSTHIEGRYHFCLDIPGVVTLDTAYLGKQLFGKVFLTRLGKRDYKVYSSGECNESND